MFVKKEMRINFYAPFDYITGQDREEFHEERIEDEQEEIVRDIDDRDINRF